MSEIDYPSLIEPVARHFWGEPNKGLTTKIGMRFGSQGSKSIVFETGGWYDHEQHVGSGVLGLVMHEVDHVSTEAEAHRWLEDNGFIAKEGAPARQPLQVAPEPLPQDDPPPFEPDPPREAEPKGEEIAVAQYDYTDRDGNFQYRVIRYQYRLPDGSWRINPKTGNPAKTFKQKSRDQSGAITWGLNGRSPCLFRWPETEIAVSEGKTVFIVEGEKDALTLVDWELAATTNSGGAQGFKPEFVPTFAGADVVICADADEAGQKRVDDIAKMLRGTAARVRAIRDWGGPKDVTDWRDAGGTAGQLLAMVADTPAWRPPPPVSKMGAVGLDNLHRRDLHHDFVIDGFLDRRGVAMMPGASGSAKTFLVLELGMCIATNRDFWGMKVKPGLVIYQAGEGKEGVTKRLDGWLQDRGVEPSAAIPFQMLPRKVNLFVDDKDTDDLIAEAWAWSEYYEQPVRLVVIDTFNKAITGANENAGQDMSKVLSRLERISESLDCAVLVPMHKSKQGDMRGHTSLTGDVSNVLNVTKLEIRDANGRQIRTVSLDKNKDGEGGRPMRFVLRQVVTGVDDEGKPITTCVVDRPDGDEASLVEEGKLSAPMTIFLDTLRIAIDVEGKEPADGVASAGRRVVDYTAFEARLRKRFTFKAGEHEPQAREKEFKAFLSDSGRRLIAAKYIDRDNSVGVIWWTGKSDRPWKTKKAAEPPPPLPASVRAEINDMDVPF